MATDLVTKAEYKAYAGITSDTQDAIITATIPKVSQLVKTLCRRTFVDYISDAKTEVYSGGRGSKLFLTEYPILSVSGVELSTDYGANYTSLVEYTDYVLDLEDGSIVAVGIDAVFPKYINGYKISYTAGYEVLPEDLKVAVLDLVTYYIKNDGSVHSPKAPGTNTVQIEYITTTNLPAHIKRVLDLYTGSFD
jgi:uncharacterized phiE125 gp8 family phage protein